MPFCTPPMQNARSFFEKSRKPQKTIKNLRKIRLCGSKKLHFFSSSSHSSSDNQRFQNAFKMNHQTPKMTPKWFKNLDITLLYLNLLHFTLPYFTLRYFTICLTSWCLTNAVRVRSLGSFSYIFLWFSYFAWDFHIWSYDFRTCISFCFLCFS